MNPRGPFAKSTGVEAVSFARARVLRSGRTISNSAALACVAIGTDASQGRQEADRRFRRGRPDGEGVGRPDHPIQDGEPQTPTEPSSLRSERGTVQAALQCQESARCQELTSERRRNSPYLLSSP